MAIPFKPTPEQLRAAVSKTVPDLIAAELDVLFCGINPGLYSGATGHHFARPGNRFWPALHVGGFTPHVVKPQDERELLTHGCGITNVVARTTATAAELSVAELIAGGRLLERKVRRYRPRVLAVLGVTAYRTAFGAPKAQLGPQPVRLADTLVWILPNPSGLNAHYTPAALGRLFGELRSALR